MNGSIQCKRAVLYIQATGSSAPPLLYAKTSGLTVLRNAPLQGSGSSCPSALSHSEAFLLLNFAYKELIVAADNRVMYREGPRTPQIARGNPLDSWGFPSFLEMPGQIMHNVRNKSKTDMSNILNPTEKIKAN
jgi:hypothetical protein